MKDGGREREIEREIRRARERERERERKRGLGWRLTPPHSMLSY